MQIAFFDNTPAASALLGILETAGVVLGMLVVVAPVVLLAMDERNRRKFAAKSDVCDANGRPRFLNRDDAAGMSQRLDREIATLTANIDRNTGLFVALDDRTGDLEEKTALLEERQSQQWGRISEQMAMTAKAMDGVASRIERVTDMQHNLALEMERIHKHGSD